MSFGVIDREKNAIRGSHPQRDVRNKKMSKKYLESKITGRSILCTSRDEYLRPKIFKGYEKGTIRNGENGVEMQHVSFPKSQESGIKKGNEITGRGQE